LIYILEALRNEEFMKKIKGGAVNLKEEDAKQIENASINEKI
jgi:hypothetical protein